MFERTAGWMNFTRWNPRKMPREDFLEETQNAYGTEMKERGSAYDVERVPTRMSECQDAPAVIALVLNSLCLS